MDLLLKSLNFDQKSAIFDALNDPFGKQMANFESLWLLLLRFFI